MTERLTDTLLDIAAESAKARRPEELRIETVMRDVVGSPISDFLIIRAVTDPHALARQIREEGTEIILLSEPLETVYDADVAAKRIFKLKMRVVVLFLAAGGDLWLDEREQIHAEYAGIKIEAGWGSTPVDWYTLINHWAVHVGKLHQKSV